jgi:hypothetical protein
MSKPRPTAFFTGPVNLLLALGLLAASVGWIEAGVLRHTGGVFMYPLDDTFIHMQLAQNLAGNGTWGMNPGEFSGASSSLLYTVLLAAGFLLFPGFSALPFVINLVAAVALLFVINRWLEKTALPPLGRLVTLLLVVVLTPLPMLVVSGMEHTLQCLFVILFLHRLHRALERGRGSAGLYLAAAAVTAIRFEGLFLVGAAFGALLLARAYRPAALMLLAGALPILAFGVYSLGKGAFFLPNSVLIKGETPPLNPAGLARFVSAVLVDKLTVSKTITALATQRLLLILPLLYLLFRGPLHRHRADGAVLGVLFLTVLLHLSLASTGWFYRYEAYLVLAAILLVAAYAGKYGFQLPGRQPLFLAAAAAILFALCFPFLLRSMAGYSKAKQACINIYEQQYQMGQFVQKGANSEVIAANDIGAISYFTNARIVDLWGLGNTEVARSRKGGYWTPDFLQQTVIADKVRYAVVYDSWFPAELRRHWTRVATWQIQNNVICGDDLVSFYAIRPEDATQLRQQLLNFSPQLPAGVKVTYDESR